MFGSTTLDIVISLVFIFLLYSLLATTILELLASAFNWRAKILEKGIKRILDGDGDINFSQHFFNHPLFKYFGRASEDKTKKGSKPSYISSQNFSKIMIDIMKEGKHGVDSASAVKSFIDEQYAAHHGDNTGVAGGGTNNIIKKIDGETIKLIKSFSDDVENDIDKMRVVLERWFDDLMLRTSGWYKRHTQVWLLGIGFTMAIMFNVNTIGIVGHLSRDKAATAQLAQMATDYVKTNPLPAATRDSTYGNADKTSALVDSAKAQLNGQIKDANNILGLGYNAEMFEQYTFGNYLMMLIGWLITALAISLGAPFWYNQLSRIASLRSSGSKPDEKK